MALVLDSFPSLSVHTAVFPVQKLQAPFQSEDGNEQCEGFAAEYSDEEG